MRSICRGRCLCVSPTALEVTQQPRTHPAATHNHAPETGVRPDGIRADTKCAASCQWQLHHHPPLLLLLLTQPLFHLMLPHHTRHRAAALCTSHRSGAPHPARVRRRSPGTAAPAACRRRTWRARRSRRGAARTMRSGRCSGARLARGPCCLAGRSCLVFFYYCVGGMQGVIHHSRVGL